MMMMMNITMTSQSQKYDEKLNSIWLLQFFQIDCFSFYITHVRFVRLFGCCCIYSPVFIFFLLLLVVRSLLFGFVEYEKQDNQYIHTFNISLYHLVFFSWDFFFSMCDQSNESSFFALLFASFAHIVAVIGINRIWPNWSFTA